MEEQNELEGAPRLVPTSFMVQSADGNTVVHLERSPEGDCPAGEPWRAAVGPMGPATRGGTRRYALNALLRRTEEIAAFVRDVLAELEADR